MTEPAATALIGLDNPHSSGWLTALQHSSSVGRLTVCTDGDCEGVDQVYGDLDALLVAERLEFALVCTRNDRAPELAARLLEAGVPVIVEKPVGRTAAEIAPLNTLAAQKQLIWATAFMNRCHPIAQKLRELVANGVLGDIVSIEGRMVTSTVQQRNPEHWLFHQQLAGGGITHWLAIHTIDLIRYITGLEYCSVSAHKATLSGTGIDVEDLLVATFDMGNGAIGNLHAGYVLPRRYGDIYMCFRGTDGDATWEMYGMGGKVDRLVVQSRADGWTDDDHRVFELSVGDAPGYGGASGQVFIADFIAASRGEGEFITSGDDALRAVRFVEAAYRGADTGTRISLDA